MAAENSFGTFLEARELLRKGVARDRSTVRGDDVNALTLILENEFPAKLPDLLTHTELGLEEFTSAVQRLQKAGLLEMTSEDGQALAILTPSGAALKA